MSVTAACAQVEVAAKTGAVASTAAAVMEIAPPPLLRPRTGTGAGITETATARAQTSTRVTAGATTPATTVSLEALEPRISLTNHKVSSVSLLHLQEVHSLLCRSSLFPHSPHSWASWGNRHSLLGLLPHLPLARHLPESSVISKKHRIAVWS